MPRKYKRKRNYKRKNKVTVPRTMVSYNGIKNFKLRQSFDVITGTAANEGDLAFHIQPNSLSKFFQQVGSSAQPLQEYTALQALFDQYRVQGVRLDWIPTYQNVEQTLKGGVGDLGPTPTMSITYDIDNQGSYTYEASLTRDRLRLKHPLKRWSYYTKIQKNMQGFGGSGSTAIVLPGGWMNLQSENLNIAQSINVVCSDRFIDGTGADLDSEQIGTLVATCYVQCKVRQ